LAGSARNVLRAAHELNPEVEIVAVNDIGEAATFAHLLKHDTTFGTFPPSVESVDGEIVVGGRGIKFLSTPDPAQLPWRDLGADIVIESTGHYTDSEKARTHIDEGGAKKVIISAPALDHRKVQLLVRVEQRPCLDHAEPGYVLRRLRPLPA
jgi:glyceraldehyde 3-phosphate dehydrogenase